MGATKIQTSTTSAPSATAQESALNTAQLNQFNQYEPGQTEMFKNAFAMGNQLLTSFGDKSGAQWQSLIGGITPQQTQSMVNTQNRSLKAQLNQNGIYDSGTAASGMLRSSADLSNQNAQFNVGTLQNALNLALTGQAQIQSPAMGQSGQLSSALTSLRSNQTTGVQSNPFNGLNLGILGNWGGSNYSCWVAAEIFGGDYTKDESWEHEKVKTARYYINFISPCWFNNFYIKHGEAIAKFIHNKPILKMMIKPLFEYFALRGKQAMKWRVA